MATVSVARTGTPKPTPYALMLDINPDTNLLTGTVGVTGDASTAAIAGWRNKWSTTTPVTAQLGVHAFEMSLDTGSAALTNAPAGHGYGTVTVTNTGITTVTSHVGDGSAVSTSGVLGPSGEVLVFQTLYTNKGSVTGTIGINADSTHSIVPASDGGHPLASLLVWQKLAGTSTRDPSPFPGNLGVEVTGGLYTATTPYAGLSATTVGGATFSAQLLFSGANVNASLTNPDVSLWVTNKNVISFPTGTANPGSITALTVTSTGGFNGKFTLKDGSVLRSSIAFQGQLVPNHGSAVASDKGFGNFLLPQLASPPTTTASTSPILSGAVVLKGL